MNLEQIAEMLMEIRADIKVMKRDLGEDYKQLHGNGKPGLIAQHQDLEVRVATMEKSLQEMRDSSRNRSAIVGNVIGHIIAIGAALLSFFSK